MNFSQQDIAIDLPAETDLHSGHLQAPIAWQGSGLSRSRNFEGAIYETDSYCPRIACPTYGCLRLTTNFAAEGWKCSE